MRTSYRRSRKLHFPVDLANPQASIVRIVCAVARAVHAMVALVGPEIGGDCGEARIFALVIFGALVRVSEVQTIFFIERGY
jgi:hypothetical protein